LCYRRPHISAIVQGTLAEYVLDEANNFDYLGLHVGASFEDFPKSYNGVSGGGIWYQKFIRVTESSYVAEPFLAGVACWESEATIKRGWKVRKVTGHGFVSIYSQLRRALYDKWVNE
jgi:hypothetical protein